MANFKGHALPGSFFLLFGLWWSVKYPLRHLSQRTSKKSHGNHCFQRADAIEGGVKIAFALIGMLAEQFVPDGPHLYLYSGEKRDWVKLMNWQHTTMYLFYGLSGMVDVFTYFSQAVPLGLDRLMLSLAVFVEGFLFYYHVLHRPMLDQHIHSLLLIAIFAGAFSTLLEVFLRDNIVLELFRAGVTIIQGTWFWQIGVVLFQPWGGPMWDEKDHDNVMFLTMCFFWHWAGAVFLLTINYTLIYCCVQRCSRIGGDLYIGLGVRQPKRDMSSRAAFLNASDDDRGKAAALPTTTFSSCFTHCRPFNSAAERSPSSWERVLPSCSSLPLLFPTFPLCCFPKPRPSWFGQSFLGDKHGAFGSTACLDPRTSCEGVVGLCSGRQRGLHFPAGVRCPGCERPLTQRAWRLLASKHPVRETPPRAAAPFIRRSRAGAAPCCSRREPERPQVQRASPMPSSFIGNALRGTFFLLFGLWWSVKYPLKYLRRKAGAEDASSYGPQRLEVLEGTIKAFFALTGILAEQLAPAGPHLLLYSPETHRWADLSPWHYTTVYLFFLLSGVVDVLSHSPLKLPLGLDRLALAVALLVEGLLFSSHDSSEAALDGHLRGLLAIGILAGALCALLEVFIRDHFVLELLRTSSFLLQGSWFWQMGFVLSPPWGGPGWDPSDRGNFVFLTMCFCWHYAGALAVMAANSAASRCCNESCQLKFGDIDVELDCGMCVRKGKSSGGALLPEGGQDDK